MHQYFSQSTDEFGFPALIKTSVYLRKIEGKYCKDEAGELPVYDFFS